MSEYRVRVQNFWSGEPKVYYVSDIPDKWNGNYEWPNVAEFRVSARYSADEQRRRALEYAAYMNKTVVEQPAFMGKE